MVGAALLVLGATFVLAACGLGGDDSTAAEPTDIVETAPVAAEPIEPPVSLTECPTTDVAGDLDLSGNCTIGVTVIVSGSVAIKDGTLVVLGTIDGSVNQSGSGAPSPKVGAATCAYAQARESEPTSRKADAATARSAMKLSSAAPLPMAARKRTNGVSR